MPQNLAKVRKAIYTHMSCRGYQELWGFKSFTTGIQLHESSDIIIFQKEKNLTDGLQSPCLSPFKKWTFCNASNTCDFHFDLHRIYIYLSSVATEQLALEF